MITIVSPDLQRLAVGSRGFGKALQSSTRKSLRVIASTGAAEARAKIRGMPVKGDVPYKESAGLRADIATATKVSASVSSSRGASISIRVARTGALAKNNRYSVAKGLDGKQLRHPLFGNREHWYTQQSYPWFFSTIVKHAPEMREAAETALRFATLASIPNVR